MRRGIWAVVPVKRFVNAKGRLSTRWGPELRSRLAAAMLEDVLAALARADGLAGTMVVTGEESARAIANRYGADILGQTEDNGLNAAVRQGLDELTRRGARGALVLPGDLPFATSAAIAQAAAAITAPRSVVLVAAGRDGGTNLLGLTLPSALPLAFGADSLARHAHAARGLGIEPTILHCPDLAVDVDVPGDLSPPSGLVPGRFTSSLLRDLEL